MSNLLLVYYGVIMPYTPDHHFDLGYVDREPYMRMLNELCRYTHRSKKGLLEQLITEAHKKVIDK